MAGQTIENTTDFEPLWDCKDKSELFLMVANALETAMESAENPTEEQCLMWQGVYGTLVERDNSLSLDEAFALCGRLEDAGLNTGLETEAQDFADLSDVPSDPYLQIP